MDYEIARWVRGRSTPKSGSVDMEKWVRSVPDAGELQANVSLANADRESLIRTMSRTTRVSGESMKRPKAKPASLWQGVS